MFDAEPEITRKVEALLIECDGRSRGDFIAHETIALIIDERPNEGRWGAVIERTKGRLLRERGITLHNERGEGYYLATHNQQVFDQSEDRAKRAARQQWRIVRALDAIPDDELPTHLRVARVAIMQEASASRKKLLRDTRIVRHLFNAATRKAPVRKHKRERKRLAKRARFGRRSEVTGPAAFVG